MAPDPFPKSQILSRSFFHLSNLSPKGPSKCTKGSKIQSVGAEMPSLRKSR
jgi:hypothetical protein